MSIQSRKQQWNKWQNYHQFLRKEELLPQQVHQAFVTELVLLSVIHLKLTWGTGQGSSLNPVSRNELNLLTFYHFSVASEEAIEEYGLVPLARIVGYGVSGCEPTIMGIGPVPATRAMCEATGINLVDVDQIEINEAFGAQTLACAKELEIPLEKLNTCGGAIALGHPLAASGSRISAHIVHKLRRNGEKYGIGSACIGGGQGISILFEAM